MVGGENEGPVERGGCVCVCLCVDEGKEANKGGGREKGRNTREGRLNSN